jgi:hypothetical protein
MIDRAILDAIRSRANAVDATGAWPGEDLDDLARAGVMRSAIPTVSGT